MDVTLYSLLNNKLKNKASLVNGKVPEDQLPSYVDDVINGYYNDVDGKFYEHFDGTTYTDEITPEEGKIYVDLTTDVTFRWSGVAFVQVGPTGPVVVANPTLAGTEPNLEGLQVGSQKYKVPDGGGNLYYHLITITDEEYKNKGVFSIINNSNEQITSLSGLDGTYQATGGTGSTGKLFMYVEVSNNGCKWYYKDYASQYAVNFTGTISDTVTQLL